MATKKKSGVNLHDVQKRITEIEEALGKTQNVSPENIVGRIGDLFDKISTGEENAREYGALALTVAVLLDEAGVHDISFAASQSISARWAYQVHPLASLLNRVHTAFLVHVEEREELYPDALQKLWAALEVRCEPVTSVPFHQAIEAALEGMKA